MTKDEILEKAKPILFNRPMVQAILDGRKTETRRVVKPQPCHDAELLTDNLLPETVEAGEGAVYAWSDGTVTSPPHQPGDYLYVRETWAPMYPDDVSEKIVGYMYKADDGRMTGEDYDRIFPNGKEWTWPGIWRPSIHMPKEAARIFLKVKGVKVERLQEIVERGRSSAEAEGFVNDINLIDGTGASATRHFADTWDNIIKPADRDRYGWETNPWVWVCKFERMIQDEAGD